MSARDSLEADRPRWRIRRGLIVQRWRIVVYVKAFRGNGFANFDFEFRFGFPRHSPAVQQAQKEMLRVYPD